MLHKFMIFLRKLHMTAVNHKIKSFLHLLMKLQQAELQLVLNYLTDFFHHF